MKKRLVLLQALAILFTVFQYGMRAAGQEEGGNSDRILSSVFQPYLTARMPLAGSAADEWLATKNRVCICVHIHRRYCGMPLWLVLPRILIGIVYTYGNRTTRTIWCYCSDKVYLYQLILKSVLFYALMEWSALVNEMLLMLAGDIESNPGPRGKPTLPELLSFRSAGNRINIATEVATKYVQFGTILLQDTTGERVRNMAHKHLNDPERINTDILQEWLTGKGKLPVTWATLVEVLNDIELSTLADSISTVHLLDMGSDGETQDSSSLISSFPEVSCSDMKFQ